MSTPLLKFRYRWDTSGGWLEVPLMQYKRRPIKEYLTACSRYDKELEMVYLDGETDALRFLDSLRCELGLTPISKGTLSPLASDQTIQIDHICEGRVSTIRRLPSLLKSKLK